MNHKFTSVVLRALLLVSITASVLLHNSPDLVYAQGIDKTYEENSSAPVATFEASDEEGTVVAWFLTGIDGGDFQVDDGTLRFRRPPDYEAPTDADGDNVYEVSVNVTDGTNTSTADLTVTVTNVEESGTVYLSSLQPEVDIPLTASLTDPDGGVTDVTWAWEISTDASSWSSISGATSSSYTPLAADVDKYLRVTANYTDAEGPGKQAQEVSYFVVREPHPPGHAPEFPDDEDGARSVAENTAPGTPIGTPLAAIDEEGHVLTYTLSGADARFFDLNRSSGQLLAKVWLDYEARTSYSMMLTVSDPTNASDELNLTVNITNVDEVGTLTLSTPQPFAGDEMDAYLDDPDGDEDNIFWLWERSQDRTDWTAIAEAEPESDVYTPVAQDVGRYLRVTASYTDGEGPDKSAQAVSFNPVKATVDHSPVFPPTETGLRSVAENTPPGTPIGEPFTAADADGHTLTYFLLDELDADSFDIDSSSGQLLTKAPLDHETKSLYRLTVAVHDGGDEHEADDHSLDATLAVTVIVTDVDEYAVEDCIQPMPDSGTVTGTWDVNCLSENRPNASDGSAGSDYYARYYTFTLQDAASVTIALTSEQDTYLYLMSGSGAGGDVLESNDDIERHTDRNSRIEVDALDAGEYTIEATTYDADRTGEFILRLEVVEVEEPPAPVIEYTEISSGANHVCALTTEGAVMCWGADDFGQMSGHPTTGRFVQISSGDNHSCALRDDGAVICWGSIMVP